MTTTDFPPAPRAAAAAPVAFDSGPLSWVMLEIREALTRSRTALFEAGGRAPEERATALQHAKTHLHQAHGALQMVDVDGVDLLTGAAEQVLARFRDGTLDCHVDHAQAVADLYVALTEYLEGLLAGVPPQPVRLFPYYRALQELLGAPRIHPAELFYPPAQPVGSIAPAAPLLAPDYPASRQRFEKALLPFLKSADEASRLTHAATLLEAIRKVADAQSAAPARLFWFTMQSFAELVADGQLDNGLYVKQLFGLINLQMRRLTQGTATLPDGMLRDALFFIASVEQPGPNAQLLRRAFRLDGLVPADFETRRYGQVDLDALAQAQQHLAQAKASWDRLSAADVSPAIESAYQHALALLASASDQLKLPALALLMRQLGEVAAAAVRLGRNEALELEMTTALLFAENSLELIRRLPDDFVGNAEIIGARLRALVAGEALPAPSRWQGDLSRQMAQDHTVAALAGEMKTGLRQVEKVLDEFYADRTTRAALAQIDPVLHQLQGAMTMLDQEDAMRAALHVQQAVRQLATGGEATAAGEPAALDAIAQNIGALGFFVDMLGHNVEAAKGRFQFDPAAGTFRAIPFEKIAAADPVPVLEEELEAAPPAPAAVAAPAPAPAPAAISGGDDAVEQELLEIFIMEAEEVLAFVAATLAEPDQQRGDQENLTRLRRSFHTLKGSGRMVGLNLFAEAAAAIERVMNVWLAEQRPATSALFALLTHAASDMAAWVAELQAGAVSGRTPDGLVQAAAQVQQGAPFVAPASFDPAHLARVAAEMAALAEAERAASAEAAVPDTPVPATAPAEAVTVEAAAVAEAEAEAASDAEVAADAAAEAVGAPPAVDADASVLADSDTAEARDDNLKQVGDLQISLPLYNIYVAETDELLRLLHGDFSEWRHEPHRAVSEEALYASHTLAGSSGTVGFRAMRDLAHALEMALEGARAHDNAMDDEQHDLLLQVLERIGTMLHSFGLGELAGEQPELVAALRALGVHLAQPPKPKDSNELDELEAHLNALFADTFTSLVDAPAAPSVTDSVSAGKDDSRAEHQANSDSLAGDDFDDEPPAPALHQAAPVEATPEAVIDAPQPVPEQPAPLEAAQAEPVSPVSPAAGAVPPVPAAPVPALPEPVNLMNEEMVAVTPEFSDELDADLLPVFLEEGADLMPQIGASLRGWQASPQDAAPAQMLLRLLHTVKGSARMAGAMRLGQHAHEIETQIENMVHAGSASAQMFDELLTNYDHALQLFEQLQPGYVKPEPAAEVAAPAAGDAPAAPAPAKRATAASDMAANAASKVALVRVRADILDRLVNQAGEVSISRSKLENEIGGLRASLSEFSDNLARLRRQLREVEMQAESQIASRMSISSEREFDPLEFDRFTRLQELTRMMAESVNDVADFQENLNRTVDRASDDLVSQARLTRDLQRDLMRVRMVPFSSVSERLFRVARQSAKEVDKRVNLDIRGGAVEVDRSVLERMAAPFEHLLRNAIVHGVESRAARTAAGKSETGELLVQVSQQGNEVVIDFADDGAGLDLERIRAKARSSGLLGADEEIADAQATELIFHAGFSTADSLTELAGRGVGMDVVRSEAEALGGRVAIETEQGAGARFTIHLPLTLAVTQVVLLASGGKTYALPSILVEQVLQMKELELGAVQAAGVVQSQGHAVPFHFLSALLGDAQARPLVQRSCPVLLLKNGIDRVAIQVDEVLGNREVVVKNIGPQLSRMPGISGATVLGSGDIVLILNPVALAQHLASAAEHQPRAVEAVRDSAVLVPHEQVIMVVDDSLTVRRVTQRLLEREGYQVVLAKDGVDALEQLQALTPNLMLVDIEMPRMDGFDLTRNVRDGARTAAIPIIMITSRSADKHRNYALELGVDAYLGKPFQEPVLLATMVDLLQKARQKS